VSIQIELTVLFAVMLNEDNISRQRPRPRRDKPSRPRLRLRPIFEVHISPT